MVEEDMHASVRDYLLGQGEVTHAVVVGGSIFGEKWGSPGLLGAIRERSADKYKPPIEIVAVEVKGDGYSPVEALGKAVAHRLFAHRTWLVLPENDDIARIEEIAMSANIGLLVFNCEKTQINFATLNRPTMGNPDADEVNRVLGVLRESDKQKYDELIKYE